MNKAFVCDSRTYAYWMGNSRFEQLRGSGNAKRRWAITAVRPMVSRARMRMAAISGMNKNEIHKHTENMHAISHYSHISSGHWPFHREKVTFNDVNIIRQSINNSQLGTAHCVTTTQKKRPLLNNRYNFDHRPIPPTTPWTKPVSSQQRYDQTNRSHNLLHPRTELRSTGSRITSHRISSHRNRSNTHEICTHNSFCAKKTVSDPEHYTHEFLETTTLRHRRVKHFSIRVRASADKQHALLMFFRAPLVIIMKHLHKLLLSHGMCSGQRIHACCATAASAAGTAKNWNARTFLCGEHQRFKKKKYARCILYMSVYECT